MRTPGVLLVPLLRQPRLCCYANEMLWWRRFTLDSLPADEQMVCSRSVAGVQSGRCYFLCSIPLHRGRSATDQVEMIIANALAARHVWPSTLKDILFFRAADARRERIRVRPEWPFF